MILKTAHKKLAPKDAQDSSWSKVYCTSRKCSIKVLSKAVTKAFKLVLSQIQSFHEKSHFYFVYKKFRVVENSKPVIDRLDQKNTKQNAKLISTFDFSTLYTKLHTKT